MLNEITMGVRDYILSGKSDFTILQESVGEKPRVACRYTVKLSPKKENVYLYIPKMSFPIEWSITGILQFIGVLINI